MLHSHYILWSLQKKENWKSERDLEINKAMFVIFLQFTSEDFFFFLLTCGTKFLEKIRYLFFYNKLLCCRQKPQLICQRLSKLKSSGCQCCSELGSGKLAPTNAIESSRYRFAVINQKTSSGNQGSQPALGGAVKRWHTHVTLQGLRESQAEQKMTRFVLYQQQIINTLQSYTVLKNRAKIISCSFYQTS